MQMTAIVEAEVEKYPHPLEVHRPILYNPVTGQISTAQVNVADSVAIGQAVESKYTSILQGGFYEAYHKSHQHDGYSEKATQVQKECVSHRP